MNREEVRSDVRSIMDELYPTATWTNAMLNVHINRAYIFVSNKVRSANKKYYFSIDTITTVSGTRSYALPSNCVASNVGNIVDPDGTLLIPDNVYDFDVNDTSDTARYYDIANNLVYLDPVPTSVKVYVLQYFRRPTALSTDAIELDFPEGFELAVSLKSAEYAVKSIQGMWEPIAQDYESFFRSMISELKDNKDIRPKSIEISRYDFGKRYINKRL